MGALLPADKLPISISIATGREDRPVSGGDTMIMGLRPEFYVDTSELGGDLDIGPALSIKELSSFLRQASERAAKRLGDELHHAEWVVTRDPDVLRDKGILDTHRGCAECEDGLAAALAHLVTHPDTDLLVGQLFWAG